MVSGAAQISNLHSNRQTPARPIEPQKRPPMNIRAFVLRATVVTLPALLIACGGSDDATAPRRP